MRHEVAYVSDISPVTDGLQSLDKADTAPQARSAIDSELIKPLLQELRGLLEEDDTDAIDLVDQLEPHLRGSSHMGSLKTVMNAVNDYDFEKALEALEDISVVVDHR